MEFSKSKNEINPSKKFSINLNNSNNNTSSIQSSLSSIVYKIPKLTSCKKNKN